MDERRATGLTIAAVILVLFSALVDPRISVVLAAVLIGTGAILAVRGTPRS